MPTSNANNKKCYQTISVEPSVTLYMLAFMITTVVEQAFFVYKACRVNHGFSEEICNRLHENEFESYNLKVQVTVSNYLQWDALATNVIPCILVLFMGAWSDKHGRKLPLIIGLSGKLYYSIMIVVNSLQPTWPVEYIIFTATLPMAFTGADAMIFSSAYSYLADVTSVEDRTFRITIFDACYLSTMPIGIALGRFLFNDVTNKSYSILFTINVTLLSISIIYSLFALKYRTTAKQKPIREIEGSVIKAFFDKNHAISAVKCFKRHKGRVWLIPFLFITMCYRFQREEKYYLYIFFMNKMKWDYNKYSYFRTTQSALMLIMMLAGVPVLNRIFAYNDPIIILFGTFSSISSHILFMLVDKDWLFYLGTIIGSLSTVVGPTCRSMVSKLIASDERGRVFSLLSAADYSVPLYSGILYSQLYNITVDVLPSAFFLITIVTQLIIFIIILIIFLKVPKNMLVYKEQETKELEKVPDPSNRSLIES